VGRHVPRTLFPAHSGLAGREHSLQVRQCNASGPSVCLPFHCISSTSSLLAFLQSLLLQHPLSERTGEAHPLPFLPFKGMLKKSFQTLPVLLPDLRQPQAAPQGKEADEHFGSEREGAAAGPCGESCCPSLALQHVPSPSPNVWADAQPFPSPAFLFFCPCRTKLLERSP